jgi:hypothetical protein
MARRWKASLYKYADGFPWNDDRYEVFILTDAGSWKSVGGAISRRGKTTVAFLCDRATQRSIRTMHDVVEKAEICILADGVSDALKALRTHYPDPEVMLARAKEQADATF